MCCLEWLESLKSLKSLESLGSLGSLGHYSRVVERKCLQCPLLDLLGRLGRANKLKQSPTPVPSFTTLFCANGDNLNANWLNWHWRCGAVSLTFKSHKVPLKPPRCNVRPASTSIYELCEAFLKSTAMLKDWSRNCARLYFEGAFRKRQSLNFRTCSIHWKWKRSWFLLQVYFSKVKLAQKETMT